MKKRIIRIFAFSFIIVLTICASVVFIKIKTTTKPNDSIKVARENIAMAQRAGADKYAPTQLKTANDLYNSAMKNWKVENEKFFLSRDFSATINYAAQSSKYSLEAKHKAEKISGKLTIDLKEKIEELRKTVLVLQTKYSNLPVAIKERTLYPKGKIYLDEAQNYYSEGNLLLAEQKYNDAERLIIKYKNEVEITLKNYFSKQRQWKSWVDETIYYSRTNKTYCIVVDKFARECRLYYDGNIVYTFEAEFGKYWIGDKKQQGDHSTPEGKYMVTKKKERGNTIYYKALLINYPNEEDKEQFKQNKQSGLIAPGRGIGGLVEIHGEGGKGADWTEGCVALSNKDMDKLYSKCQVGTKVTIVGSLKSLEEVLSDRK